jgi:hypothetical protein
MLINEGFGVTRRTPRQFARNGGSPGIGRVALRTPYPAFIAGWSTGPSVRGNNLNRVLSCIRTAAALAAVALAVAGCAAANNATSSQAQGEQPYRAMYGLTSDGPTTDLYTEFFGPREPPPAPATNVASAQPVQPVAGQPTTPAQQAQQYQRPGQAVATTLARPNQAQTAAASRTPQPGYGQPASVQPPPVQVAQQPAPPAPPPEPNAPVAYGISANGPTTDLYTMLFGPRHSDSQ